MEFAIDGLTSIPELCHFSRQTDVFERNWRSVAHL
jgi:hypothetical protein